MRAQRPTIRPFSEMVTSVEHLAGILGEKASVVAELAGNAEHLYTSFKLPKPDGGEREIKPPRLVLRTLQRKILRSFGERVRYPSWMMGSVPARSGFQHAGCHTNALMVATFDVKEFFPSTKCAMVLPVLEQFGLRSKALECATRLVLHEGGLPQGSPTSGLLANLVMDRADRRIDGFCRKRGLRFSRYVDDIAISGDCDLRSIRGTIVGFVEELGYKVPSPKIHFMGQEVRQVVTKLVVNDKLRPTAAFIDDVKRLIWECLKNGPAIAAAEHGVTVIRLKQQLTGRVTHIQQADPDLGRKLRGRLRGIVWTHSAAVAVP